jgi:hypothetical protein
VEASPSVAKKLLDSLRLDPTISRDFKGTLKEMGRALDENVEKRRAASQVAKDDAKLLSASTKATETNTDAVKANAMSQDERRDAIENVRQAQLGMFDAEIAALTAARDFNELMKESKDPLEQVGGLLNLAGTNAQLASQKFQEMTGSGFSGKQMLEAQRDELIKLREQYPQLRTQIDGYILRLQWMIDHPNIGTKVTADTSQATDAIYGLKRLMDTLFYSGPGGSIGIKGPGIGQVIPGEASGGPVQGNKLYLVGEKGPELFMPRSSGTIIPNHRLKAGGGSAVAVDGSGGGGTRTVNVTINTAMTPRDVVQAIRQYERENGNGWRQN